MYTDVYTHLYGLHFAGGILLGFILIMYEFHKFLPFLLLFVHSFWIPQIVTNIVRDLYKPLHPYYIVGMSVTRLAIPLYIFGCPRNFMHTKPAKYWCICLVGFVGLQSLILLLQHYLGSQFIILYQVCCNFSPFINSCNSSLFSLLLYATLPCNFIYIINVGNAKYEYRCQSLQIIIKRVPINIYEELQSLSCLGFLIKMRSCNQFQT